MDFLSHRWTARLLVAAWCPMLLAETGTEYEVKAAFLYKFANFVEWPADEGTSPLGICVLGQDPFGLALDRVVKGKFINGREFMIRRLRTNDVADDCHILFIGASENRQLTQILNRLRGLPVLTVGDVAGFCENGGTINLVVSGKRVRLEINPASAERARLLLSSRLLSLARIVRDEAKGSR